MRPPAASPRRTTGWEPRDEFERAGGFVRSSSYLIHTTLLTPVFASGYSTLPPRHRNAGTG